MEKFSDTNEREWEKGDNRMAIYTTTPSKKGETIGRNEEKRRVDLLVKSHSQLGRKHHGSIMTSANLTKQRCKLRSDGSFKADGPIGHHGDISA